MMKRDRDIEKLFDDYAAEQPARPELADRARSRLAQRANPKRKRSGAVVRWVACCCAVAVVVVGLAYFVPRLLADNPGSQNAVDNYASYSPLYVTAKNDGGNYRSMFGVDGLDSSPLYSVVYERYTAFFDANDKLMYVRIALGVRADNNFVEMDIIAETDGFVRADLVERYRAAGSSTDEFSVSTRRGEYVTSAFMRAGGYHFYISAITGADPALAHEIALKLTENLL